MVAFLTNISPFSGVEEFDQNLEEGGRLMWSVSLVPQAEKQMDFKSPTLITCDITGSETHRKYYSRSHALYLPQSPEFTASLPDS